MITIVTITGTEDTIIIDSELVKEEVIRQVCINS